MNPFGVQKVSAFGTFGEFSLGATGSTVRARYILTKIRPGVSGDWECQLASHMVPWREVFNIEELSFDELLQRDLDDSRVAHDLVPYLLGHTGADAKFFPPILAVIVPRSAGQVGIRSAYPAASATGEGAGRDAFGDLFDVEQVCWPPQQPGAKPTPTPLAKLSYNPQQAAFIIVDGQHRAMAILALHRQLNSGSWNKSSFASYYSHIDVKQEQVKDIELPVCIIYFPDLHEGNPALFGQTNLKAVCRDIFLVVNKNAKPVTESRQVLLEDEDLAAWMMRRTLSSLKGRPPDKHDLSRIYSIAYGDSDADLGKQVAHGQLEYSTAITLFKIQAAVSFGRVEAFTWKANVDITDGRHTRNSNRPAEILLGTNMQHHGTVSRRSGKTMLGMDAFEIASKLGALADSAVLTLFDRFRPFVLHNEALMQLKTELAAPEPQADPVQKKCESLIFEGSGVRNIFEAHAARLRSICEEQEAEGKGPDGRMKAQVVFCDSVNKAMSIHQSRLQRRKAASFFSMNEDAFFSKASEAEQRLLEEKARKVFQTVSTQAFQLGFAMAVFSTVEELKRKNLLPSELLQYQERCQLVGFVSQAFVAGLNRYFSPSGTSKHTTMAGYVLEPRAAVFDSAATGLRGLHAMQGGELNERQWPFFRYVVLEIVHSPLGWRAAVESMGSLRSEMPGKWYLSALPGLVEALMEERKRYLDLARDAHVANRSFENLVQERRFTEKGAGKDEAEIEAIVQELIQSRATEGRTLAESHVKASLGGNETSEVMLKRLVQEMSGTPDHQS